MYNLPFKLTMQHQKDAHMDLLLFRWRWADEVWLTMQIANSLFSQNILKGSDKPIRIQRLQWILSPKLCRKKKFESLKIRILFPTSEETYQPIRLCKSWVHRSHVNTAKALIKLYERINLSVSLPVASFQNGYSRDNKHSCTICPVVEL